MQVYGKYIAAWRQEQIQTLAFLSIPGVIHRTQRKFKGIELHLAFFCRISMYGFFFLSLGGVSLWRRHKGCDWRLGGKKSHYTSWGRIIFWKLFAAPIAPLKKQTLISSCYSWEWALQKDEELWRTRKKIKMIILGAGKKYLVEERIHFD